MMKTSLLRNKLATTAESNELQKMLRLRKSSERTKQKVRLEPQGRNTVAGTVWAV